MYICTLWKYVEKTSIGARFCLRHALYSEVYALYEKYAFYQSDYTFFKQQRVGDPI